MLKSALIPFAVAALLFAAGLPIQGRTVFAEELVRVEVQEPRPVVHLEGCVFTESSLTGTVPDTISAGSVLAYVLTQVKVISGAVPADVAAKTTYSLKDVDQDRMRSLYRKRVGVTGRTGTGSDRPDLDVVSIREISGGCSPRPDVS